MRFASARAIAVRMPSRTRNKEARRCAEEIGFPRRAVRWHRTFTEDAAFLQETQGGCVFFIAKAGDASAVPYAPGFVRWGGEETGEKNSGHKVLRLCFFFAILYREKNFRNR